MNINKLSLFILLFSSIGTLSFSAMTDELMDTEMDDNNLLEILDKENLINPESQWDFLKPNYHENTNDFLSQTMTHLPSLPSS